MARILLPLFFVLLLTPAFAFADAGDDYGDDTSYYSCSDVAGVVDQCRPECVHGDWLTYCGQHLTEATLDECMSTGNCGGFNDCLCASSDDDGNHHHDDRGCGVTRGARGFALPLAMFGIGLAALGYSLRGSRRR